MHEYSSPSDTPMMTSSSSPTSPYSAYGASPQPTSGYPSASPLSQQYHQQQHQHASPYTSPAPMHSPAATYSTSQMPYSVPASAIPSASPHHATQPTYAQLPQDDMSSAPKAQIRQRVKHLPDAEEKPDTMRKFVRRLKTLDVYPKTEEDLAIKTQSGGIISLVSFTIIAFLILAELYNYFVPPTQHSIVVDTRPTSKLQINFDVVFHALRCSDTSIDVMDVSGDVQVAAEANIHRTRLTPDGEPIGYTEYEDHAHDPVDANGRPNPNVNPALIALGLQAYGGGPDVHQDQRGEGCRVRGKLLVNKVAGNVHIALGGVHSHGQPHASEQHTSAGHSTSSHEHGHQHGQQPQHLHQFMIHEMASYNCSHTIRHFSFGEHFPGIVNPLDGVSHIIPLGTGSAHIQYFIKVVPTRYESSWTSYDTNQYSFTQHTTPITMQDAYGGGVGGGRIPGTFWIFDIAAYQVRVSKKGMPLSTFITSLLAIVGGVLTIAGILDSLLYHGNKLVRIASPHKKG